MRPALTIVLLSLALSCASPKPFPEERHYAFLYYFNRDYKNDTILFSLKNPLQSPINIRVVQDSNNLLLSERFGTMILQPLADTVVKIHYPGFNGETKTGYMVKYGDFRRKVESNPIAFPFPMGKGYRIIQGYRGKLSHKTIYSRYAIDFDLKIGDTISSADDGFVVGVIEDYKDYGTSKKWRENDRSNYITLYHPHSGLYTQYVHLDHQGALAELGDYVQKGQPIALSGMTGYTTTPHLHFNVKIPTEDRGLISTPVEFENGIRGEQLKKGHQVRW